MKFRVMSQRGDTTPNALLTTAFAKTGRFHDPRSLSPISQRVGGANPPETPLAHF
jgi:hypothetical protein